ncbi:HugZ family protein [Azospirillum griseum]|uniref:Heme iron utilization protein n=1 Tax=Azospirillum griseum TaxID=2496639 RepID=A0A431VIY2_9PROT|nr:pyridoxamine 5'-phosphate oxidase family protein [Azospirillum griseum]RTR21881.1 heme iron utilization protein [Azospirillum griseum]
MSSTQALGASARDGMDGASPVGANRPHAESARRLMRACDRASLATAGRAMDKGGASDGTDDGAGWPYPSLVLVAFDLDGSPLLLLSALAEHTRNLSADPRVGLLFDGTGGLDQPLTGARLSVLGRVVRTDDPRHRDRFLRRHPDAALYAGFADFALHRVVIERAHLVAGFGRIHWLTAADLGLPMAAEALAQAEAELLDAGNALLSAADSASDPASDADAGWSLTGVDPDGLDLRRGGRVARHDFEQTTNNPESVRLALSGLPHWVRHGGTPVNAPAVPANAGITGAASSDATTTG